MRFLVDAQLPPALARWLVEHGHHADHVKDLGLQAASDWILWDRAVFMHAVIITKDEDFALRRTPAISGPAIVWVRRGNTTRGQLLQWMEPLLATVIEALERGERIVEIR